MNQKWMWCEVGATQAAMEGTLLKRSDWLRNWNKRSVSVQAATSTTRATLSWRGPQRSGSITLSASCSKIVDDELIVRGSGRELHFRIEPATSDDGGPGRPKLLLQEWRAAISSAVEADLSGRDRVSSAGSSLLG